MAPQGRAQVAQPPGEAAPAVSACGFNLGPAALAEWTDYGGADGRLGCPTADEAQAATSRSGDQSLIAAFGERGAIITHVSGPLSGRAFAVFGCAFRLFFQFGGAGGSLGLPHEDAQNTPDGQIQTFDGGLIRATRAYDSCEVVRPGDT
jgi:uncharacterized protein with LGFP repeats